MTTTDLSHMAPTIDKLALDEIARATPSAARVCDVVLGGGYNFQADRELAARLLWATPSLRNFFWSNRQWRRRVVAGAVIDGVSQILDIGCGLPTDDGVHDIAHAVNPSCRVGYVDRDPVAVALMDMVLDGHPIARTHRRPGRVENARVIQAPMQDVDTVLGSIAEFDPDRRTLVMLSGVIQFVPDGDDPVTLIQAYRDALAPGSLLALSHLTDDVPDHGVAAGVALWDRGPDRPVPRTYGQVREMLEAWGELLPAGPAAPSEVVYLPEWQPDDPGDPDASDPSSSLAWCGAARKLLPRRPR